MTSPNAEEVWDATRDAQTLADHRAGGHCDYDRDEAEGCTWPGCSDAFFRFAKAQEHVSEPW